MSPLLTELLKDAPLYEATYLAKRAYALGVAEERARILQSDDIKTLLNTERTLATGAERTRILQMLPEANFYYVEGERARGMENGWNAYRQQVLDLLEEKSSGENSVNG